MISIKLNAAFADSSLDGENSRLHGFDSDWYLENNDDVKLAVASGKLASGSAHYLNSGYEEGRAKNIHEALKEKGMLASTNLNVESCFISDTGRLFLLGWTNRQLASDSLIHASTDSASIYISGDHIRSHRRRDVEEAHPDLDPALEYGFIIVCALDTDPYMLSNELVVEIVVAGQIRTGKIAIRRVTDRALLNTFLGFVHQKEKHSSYWGGNFEFLKGEVAGFARGLFAEIVTESAKKVSIREFHRYGSPTFSHVVVLYKKYDLLPLQLALLSECAKFLSTQVEVIVGVNGADIADGVSDVIETFLLRGDLSIKLIIIPENIGFGEANNICAQAATAEILLITNPDVFPTDTGLYEKIASCLQGINENDILGGWLYYGDGSVMHVGMSYVWDNEITRDGRQISLPRVVHDFKGYSEDLLESMFGKESRRSVDAISGAWIVCRRTAFFDIGGFSKAYVWGHYEDADFCNRARQLGYKCWVDSRIRLWHLEGKGSESNSAVAVGAQLLNRITFHQAMMNRKDEK